MQPPVMVSRSRAIAYWAVVVVTACLALTLLVTGLAGLLFQRELAGGHLGAIGITMLLGLVAAAVIRGGPSRPHPKIRQD